jgi:hypothetical protein
MRGEANLRRKRDGGAVYIYSNILFSISLNDLIVYIEL